MLLDKLKINALVEDESRRAVANVKRVLENESCRAPQSP
jgi:hypothetical protein